MKCFYINLDRAADRRAALERNFAAISPPGWELVRVPALTPHEVAQVPGGRSGPEKACLYSHRRALELALAEPEPSLIVEDDTRFSSVVFGLLEQMAPTPGWDLLFTDLTLLDVDDQVTFFKQYRRLSAAGQFTLTDLRNTPFAATSAYVLSAAGKARLAGLIDGLPAVDQPYDLQLLRWVRAGELAARLSFPFLTTVTEAGLQSSIQPDASQLRGATIHALRELMFVERDLTQLQAQVDAFAPAPDPADQLLGRLLALIASEDFPDTV